MKSNNLAGWRRTLALFAVVALFVVGCGGTTTDISAAVDDTNNSLKQDNVTIDCPDEVDGGEGTKFECTLKGTKSGKTEKIEAKVIKDGIAPVDQAGYEEAVARVSG
jgi:hypothetical protein